MSKGTGDMNELCITFRFPGNPLGIGASSSEITSLSLPLGGRRGNRVEVRFVSNTQS